MAKSRETGVIKNLPRNHKLRNLTGYNGQMGILATDNTPAFHLVTCKEEFYMGVSKHLAWRDTKIRKQADEILCGPNVAKTIYTKSARVFILRREQRAVAAKRILDVVEKLRKRLNLRHATTVSYTGAHNSHAILIDADKWFLRSPVSQSALMTFIRAAMNTSFEYSSLDDFIAKMIRYSENPSEMSDDEWDSGEALDDADHFLCAKKHGVLAKFLNRKLAAVRRRGFADCRFVREDTFNQENRPDGIAEHDPKEYTYEELTEKYICGEYSDIYPQDDSDEDDDDVDDNDDEYEEVYSVSSHGAHEYDYY